MTAKKHLKKVEKILDKTFLLMAFDQLYEKYEDDPNMDMPDSLEDALETGWRGLNEQSAVKIARRERFKWHVSSCYDELLRRL